MTGVNRENEVVDFEKLTPETASDLRALGAAAVDELRRAELAKIDPNRPRTKTDFDAVENLRRVVDDYLSGELDEA